VLLQSSFGLSPLQIMQLRQECAAAKKFADSSVAAEEATSMRSDALKTFQVFSIQTKCCRFNSLWLFEMFNLCTLNHSVILIYPHYSINVI
jgi:hypothetical protein